MQLKSKYDNPISFGLPSGHAMVLGPEGAEVPQMLIQAAFAAGAVPAEAVVEEFIAAPEKTVGKTDQEAIQAAIKSMLERNAEGDFTDSGMQKSVKYRIPERTRSSRNHQNTIIKHRILLSLN